jgi:hypothetical protein
MTATTTHPAAVPAALRVARHAGNLILDLGTPDRHAVVIAPGSWHLAERSPVQFRRTALPARCRSRLRTAEGWTGCTHYSPSPRASSSCWSAG